MSMAATDEFEYALVKIEVENILSLGALRIVNVKSTHPVKEICQATIASTLP